MPANTPIGGTNNPGGVMTPTVPVAGATGPAAQTNPFTQGNGAGMPAQMPANMPVNPATGMSQAPQNNTASHVTIDPSILNSMGGYQNAAYNNQTQILDPQWQQAKSQFDQQMVGQGLQPGSDAYNQAYNNFMLSKQQAYTGAYNNSFQTGLAAQGQAFNQGYDNSQLANALRIAQMQKSATLGAAGIGANASMHNNDENNATNQLLGMGNLGLGQQQMDLSTLLGISGYMNGNTQYNNSLIGGAQNTLMGLIPNSNPSPVDVNGAYGINQSGQNAQYQGQVASANGTNQTVGALGSVAVMAIMM